MFTNTVWIILTWCAVGRRERRVLLLETEVGVVHVSTKLFCDVSCLLIKYPHALIIMLSPVDSAKICDNVRENVDCIKAFIALIIIVLCRWLTRPTSCARSTVGCEIAWLNYSVVYWCEYCQSRPSLQHVSVWYVHVYRTTASSNLTGAFYFRRPTLTNHVSQ